MECKFVMVIQLLFLFLRLMKEAFHNSACFLSIRSHSTYKHIITKRNMMAGKKKQLFMTTVRPWTRNLTERCVEFLQHGTAVLGKAARLLPWNRSQGIPVAVLLRTTRSIVILIYRTKKDPLATLLEKVVA